MCSRSVWYKSIFGKNHVSHSSSESMIPPSSSSSDRMKDTKLLASQHEYTVGGSVGGSSDGRSGACVRTMSSTSCSSEFAVETRLLCFMLVRFLCVQLLKSVSNHSRKCIGLYISTVGSAFSLRSSSPHCNHTT